MDFPRTFKRITCRVESRSGILSGQPKPNMAKTLSSFRIITNRYIEPERINPSHGIILGIDIKMILPSSYPNRVSRRIPSNRRIIVPEVIIIQPRLSVIVLPRESQIVSDCNLPL